MPHDADQRLVWGLVMRGKPRSDLVGLLSVSAQGWPETVRHAWRLTADGALEPIPSDGLTCRRTPSGLCATNLDNLAAIRGAP